MTEEPKMLSFIGILYIDKAILETEMEKHLKYLLIYFKFKTTLLFISKKKKKNGWTDAENPILWPPDAKC